MPDIEVHEPTTPGGSFLVTVHDGDTATHHRVRVREDYRRRMAPQVDAAALVEASFRFLLEREPKESILDEFDLPTIERYFPDYPDRVKDHL